MWSVGVSGLWVAAGCDDGTVCAWELETLEEAGGPGRAGAGPVRALAADGEEGRMVGAVGGELVVWG